jgi:hypothetical protein
MTRPSGRRGAALLEFAMALPFALILFIGIGDFSIYFWRQTAMEEASRLAAAQIAPALKDYLAADAAALHRLSRNLQAQVRTGSGIDNMTISLTRHYACPLPAGGERLPTAEPEHCRSERVYLRMANDDAAEPILTPLRWIGFPKSSFSRHVIRIR